MGGEKQKVLILSDDEQAISQSIEALPMFEVFSYKNPSEFLVKNLELKPQALLIDFDLREKDGLLVFRELQKQDPLNRTIMFSHSNSIPLAVQAVKIGILEFLRKPFSSPTLLKSVERAVFENQIPNIDIYGEEDCEWLFGTSSKLQTFKETLFGCAKKSNDLCLVSEKGITQSAIACLIHKSSVLRTRKFVEIKLSSFGREISESYFFLTIKELLSASESLALKETQDSIGTIFISEFEAASPSFSSSLLSFLKTRKGPARIILGSSSPAPGFEIVEIPNLRERREDIFQIFFACLKKYAPDIKYISPDVLAYIIDYDFPGNYKELESLIKMHSSSYPMSEILNLKNFPIDEALIGKSQKTKLSSMNKFSLNDARAEFEKSWIKAVLEKTNYDAATAARFLDMPRTVLIDRAKLLGLL